MGKYYNIDPETCSLEELEKEIERLDLIEQQFNTQQASCKIMLNSVYGSLGATYYNLAGIPLNASGVNTCNMAESITLQCQHLIKRSVVYINDYFKNFWNTDFNVHKLIANKMKEEYQDFDTDEFLRLAANNKLSFDTIQVYGDSVVGSSKIKTTDGEISIEDMFNEANKDNNSSDGKVRVPSDRKVYVASKKGGVAIRPIKYIMCHKTDKTLYEINLISKDYERTKSVICTKDHSIMVSCKNELYDRYFSITPRDMMPMDLSKYEAICLNDDGEIEYYDFDTIVENAQCDDSYVYDICVDTYDDYEHTFFANGILVHNTDSVSGNSILCTQKHMSGISIEDFYNENIDNVGETTLAGHESVNTDDCVYNWNGKSFYFGKIRRIIRHKISKPKWRLSVYNGRIVECTDNHSLIVFRDDDLSRPIHIKPCEFVEGDQVLSEPEKGLFGLYSADCKCIGEYKDEYVYDIEMDDDTHTFICNGTLVHNSAYITLQPLVESCNIKPEHEIKFCLYVYEYAMEGYLDRKFEEYAQEFHCTKNLEKFELEKISRSMVSLAKKNYFCDVAWTDTPTFYEPLTHPTYTGYDVVKGATPEICRAEMKTFCEFVLDCLNHHRKPTQGEIVKRLREMKTRFIMQSPNDIAKSTSISEYDKFVKDDKTPGGPIFFEFDETGKKIPVPIHVRAAANYNNMLQTKGKKYLSKYSLLKSGDKVRFYYTKPKGYLDDENSVFGFVPDNFPLEFAEEMNIDKQFEKMLLSPLNRIVVALGYSEIPPTLTYTSGLF